MFNSEGLRKFKLEVGSEGVFKFGSNSTLIFSKVAGLIAFRRMPLLSVEIVTHSSPLRQGDKSSLVHFFMAIAMTANL